MCEAGLYENGTNCTECEIGTYKPHIGNGTCDVCPSNMSTTTEGATECGTCQFTYYQWGSMIFETGRQPSRGFAPTYYLTKCSQKAAWKQDCIPVACVPTACWPSVHAAAGEGGFSHAAAGMHPWSSMVGAFRGVFPPVNRMTLACEDITFPASLRYAVGNEKHWAKAQLSFMES